MREGDYVYIIIFDSLRLIASRQGQRPELLQLISLID